MDLTFCFPLSGSVVSLGQVGALALERVDDRVLSPGDRDGTPVHRKRHAVTFADDEGVEIRIHVRRETVSRDGEEFQVRVPEGQRAGKREPLIEFDADRNTGQATLEQMLPKAWALVKGVWPVDT